MATVDRKILVQALRSAARTHKIAQVPDNASRHRVKTMALALLDVEDMEEDEEDMDVDTPAKRSMTWQELN